MQLLVAQLLNQVTHQPQNQHQPPQAPGCLANGVEAVPLDAQRCHDGSAQGEGVGQWLGADYPLAGYYLPFGYWLVPGC